jgi:hypothetical protein
MGKSKVSQAMNGMPTGQYVEAMGGSVSMHGNMQNMADRDTGINQSVNTVYRYFNQLRDYAVNRYTWKSNILEPYDLQLIEWLFFMTGKACLIYPTFYSRNNRAKGIKLKQPRIFNTNITLQNFRTSECLKVNIIDNFVNALFMPLKRDYNFRDFAMLSCNYTLLPINNVPLWHTAWEYANKLYELDLTFNANATKQRIPLIFNNGIENTNDGNQQLYNQGNFTAANLVREAMARNEQFAEIPQSRIGEKGLLHSTNQYSDNNLLDYLETQRKIYDEFFEILGVEVVQEKHGVYVSEAIQSKAFANNNYKALIQLRNRRFHAEQCNKKFGLDLVVEQLEYM